MVADLQRNLIRTILESSRGTNVPILPITSIFTACFAIALVALSFPISLRVCRLLLFARSSEAKSGSTIFRGISGAR